MSKLYPLEKAIELAQRTAVEARADGRPELAQLYEGYAALTRRAMASPKPHSEFITEVVTSAMCMLSWHTVAMREDAGPPVEIVMQHIQVIVQTFANGLMTGCGVHGHVTTEAVSQPGVFQ